MPNLQQQPEEEKKEPEPDPEEQRRMEEAFAAMHIEVDPECAICMLIMVNPTELPCKHVFCQGCAKASLGFKRECPMCRHVPARAYNFPVS